MFEEPQPVDAVNSPQNDRFGWMTADELTLYLDSTRPGGPGLRDIYVATRESVDDDFDAPVLVEGVSTPGEDGAPRLTEDGLLLFASQFDGVNWNVVAATRADVDDDFGALAPVAVVNGANYDADPYPAPDGSIYFTSDRQGSGDIFHARWSGIAFDLPEILAGADLSTAAFDGAAVVTPDELALYFISTRPGGAGAADIYLAKRDATDEPFGEAERLTELATDADEIVTWVSADECALLIERIDPENGDNDILIALRGR